MLTPKVLLTYALQRKKCNVVSESFETPVMVVESGFVASFLLENRSSSYIQFKGLFTSMNRQSRGVIGPKRAVFSPRVFAQRRKALVCRYTISKYKCLPVPDQPIRRAIYPTRATVSFQNISRRHAMMQTKTSLSQQDIHPSTPQTMSR
jgi:hypothetical protein